MADKKNRDSIYLNDNNSIRSTQLIEGLKDSNSEAYDVFMDYCVESQLSYCRYILSGYINDDNVVIYLAEEVIQESVTAFFEALANDEKDIKCITFFYRIVERQRKKRFRKFVTDSNKCIYFSASNVTKGNEPEYLADKYVLVRYEYTNIEESNNVFNIDRATLDKYITKLPPLQSSILQRYLDETEFTLKKYASDVMITEDAAKKRMQRAKKALKQLLEGYLEEYPLEDK